MAQLEYISDKAESFRRDDEINLSIISVHYKI